MPNFPIWRLLAGVALFLTLHGVQPFLTQTILSKKNIQNTLLWSTKGFRRDRLDKKGIRASEKRKKWAEKYNIKPTKEERLKITRDDLCACGSGTIYSQCCQPIHQGAAATSPDIVLRARYSAYKHDIGDFIIDSTHRSNPDYEKYFITMLTNGRKKWLKELRTMTMSYDFYGLEIDSLKVWQENSDMATIRFRTLVKEVESASDFMVIQEQSTFVREGSRWLYIDGEYQSPEHDIAHAMIERYVDPEDLPEDGEPTNQETAARMDNEPTEKNHPSRIVAHGKDEERRRFREENRNTNPRGFNLKGTREPKTR
jgi:SEC-C motif-containing protein